MSTLHDTLTTSLLYLEILKPSLSKQLLITGIRGVVNGTKYGFGLWKIRGESM
jgi:hypothetical protein